MTTTDPPVIDASAALALPVGFRVVSEADTLAITRKNRSRAPWQRLAVGVGAAAAWLAFAGGAAWMSQWGTFVMALFVTPLFLGSGYRLLREATGTVTVRAGRTRIDVEERSFPWPRTRGHPRAQLEQLHALRDATEGSWRVQARLTDGTDVVLMAHIREEREANAVRLMLEDFLRKVRA